MTIYRLNYDSSKYPRVDVSPKEWMRLENKGILAPFTAKDKWLTLNAMYYDEPGVDEINRPDIMCWTSRMVFSEKAYQALKTSLEKYGNFYLVNIEDEIKYTFYESNKTDAVDPFNTEKLVIEGEDMGVIKLAFLEHEVKNLGIFRTPFDSGSYIYCTDEVKDIIEGAVTTNELTSGWSFETELREN